MITTITRARQVNLIAPTASMLWDVEIGLNLLADISHGTATEKGFHEGKEFSNVDWQLSRLMLIVSELGEACEGIRAADQTQNNLGEELADAVIRIGDLAAALNIDLGKMVRAKMLINAERPRKHGGKLA